MPVEIWARFMRSALAGQKPAPLPGGGWRQAPQASPELPMARGQPPAAPEYETAQGPRPRALPPQERNFLERLFGL
jgi:penicillin-binding protein 1A